MTDITLHSTRPVMPKQEGTRQPAYQGDDAFRAGGCTFCIATPHKISQSCKVNLFRRLIKVVIKPGKRSVWPRLCTADFLSDEGLWCPFNGSVPDPICMLWRREHFFFSRKSNPEYPYGPTAFRRAIPTPGWSFRSTEAGQLPYQVSALRRS